MSPYSTILTIFLLYVTISIDFGMSQDCSGSKGISVEEKGYMSPVVITAEVTNAGRVNHTAKVLKVVGTHGGGLSKGDLITFGPLKKGGGCTRMKNNAQYILYLEEASPDSTYHRITYNPDSKVKLVKKLNKVLCANCVKPPKFKKDHFEHVVTENQKGPTLNCKVSGFPKPMVVFLKDGVLVTKKDKGISMKIKKRGGGGKLKIKKAKKEYSGEYTCQAKNLGGSANQTYTVTVIEDVCTPCGDSHKDYCRHGRCCFVAGAEEPSCRCEDRYEGTRCENKKLPRPRTKINVVEARYHQQTIAIMAVCLALLAVIFICYVVYCRFKKSRSQLRKEIISRNGHVTSPSADGEPARPITSGPGRGIIGGDHDVANVMMTGYVTTNLSEGITPHSFAQRPQTYDDVILPAPEAQALLNQPAEERRLNYDENDSQDERVSHLERVESNGKRRRLKGIAITTHPAGASGGSAEVTPKMTRNLEHLKATGHSVASSTSSLASHDLKKPVLPIDEKLAHIAKSGVYPPPAYPYENEEPGKETVTDGPTRLEEPTVVPQHQAHKSYPVAGDSSGSVSDKPNRERMASSVSSGSVAGSTHRVTTFDTDGKIQEETLGRDDGSLQGLTPHSPSLSPQSSYQRTPRSDIYAAHELRTPATSPGVGSEKKHSDTRYPYQDKNIYPYYEHSQEAMGSPTSSPHDNDDLFSSMEIPDTSLGLCSPKRDASAQNRHNHPGSPDGSHQMSMGVPYRHAPTVASARHHYLPLLTKGMPETPADNKLLAGSTVSLSSTSNASSHESERHRDSHKIEV